MNDRADLRESNIITDNHQVHIALGLFLAACHRAVDKRQANLSGQRTQGFPKNTCHAHCLADQSVKFGVNRAILVDLVVSLPPFNGSRENSTSYQSGQFTLHRPRTNRERLNHLPLVKPFVRVVKKKTQHRLSDRTK